MGRNRIEINPECAKRVKELKKEYGFTFDFLAEKLNCDRNHVFNITKGKRNLTPDMARKMVETVFPAVRYEWLLAWDDFKTEADKDRYKQQIWEESTKAAAEYEDRIKAVIEELLYREAGIELLSEEEHPVLGRCMRILDRNNKRVGWVEMDALNSIQEQAENYISYLLRQLVEHNVTFQVKRPGVKKGNG